ncbi:MAG: hypothetical protein HN350_21635, partial [Phycisphaerales bacterium]|nr:hypothetical protein [Phycisphaerales bacterium]
MTKKNIILTLAVAAIMSIGAVANAGVIPIAASDVYAHNEKNNYGGNPTSMV